MYNLKVTKVFLLTLALMLLPAPVVAQVSDGQAVNAAVTNGAFLYKNSDTTALGKVNVNNSSDPTISGPEIFNIQRELNSLSSFTGKPINQTYNYIPSWTNNDVGTSSDSTKQRSDSITAKFNGSTGHAHTGAAGDGAQINFASLLGNISFTQLPTLSSSYILIGNASNVAAPVLMSGDATISNAGVIAVASVNGKTASVAPSSNTLAQRDASGNLTASTLYGNVPASSLTGTVSLTTQVSGVLPPGNGGTGSNLSATGGSGQVLKQLTSGGNILVAQLNCSELSNGSPSCSTDTTNASNISAGTLQPGVGGTGYANGYLPGQVLIGNAGGSLTRATLTQGTGITITNGSGSVTISSSGTAATAWNYTSQSLPYTANINDFVRITGAAGTITLPNASSVAGQLVGMVHDGAELTKYTLATFGGTQSMITPAGTLSSGSISMWTTGETYVFESDGTAFRQVNHVAQTNWISAGTNVVGAIGAGAAAPSLGTATVVTNTVQYQRNQAIGCFRHVLYKTASGTASGGNGQYIWHTPTGISANTLSLAADTNSYNGSGPAFRTNMVGHCFGIDNNGGTDVTDGFVSLYDANNVTCQGFGTSNTGSSGIRPFGSAGLSYTSSAGVNYLLEWCAQIQDWQP